MAVLMDSAAVEAAIRQLAERQWGNVTGEQLRRIGLDRNATHRRRWLVRVHTGVYSVGRAPTTWFERASAAVLACSEGAVLSHLSALALWGWAPRYPDRLDVTVTGSRRPRNVRVHRSRTLLPRDTRTHRNIRVTSPARTMLDSAPLLTKKQLDRAVNQALRSKQLRRRDLADVVARFPRRPGARALKRFIDVEGGPTRSAWEDEFPAFCAEHGLPKPVINTFVAGHEVDALFPDERVIVELDSWEFHSDRGAFESDRDRDADTLAAGHVTVRITWGRMKRQPAREADRLTAILQSRRRRAA